MEKNYYGSWFPIDISTHGYQIDNLINIVHVLMALLFVGWGVFIFLAIFKFRKKANPAAEYKPHHHFVIPTYLEIAVAVTEIVLLAAFSIPIFYQFKKGAPAKEDALEVRVVAEQFAWNIHYPGKDKVFGKTSPKLMNAMNPLGLDPEDPAGKDDISTINQLKIPVGKPVIAHLTSKDVIHSFALPVARIKQDTIPGQTIPVWFEAKQTGDFEIACAQLCGLGHYRMKGFFNVMEKEKFSAWFDEQLAKKTGQPAATA
ncbi:MAG TPA: cytochrome c oxidase subunit II [Candidatus Omnitrophota bacterium]|nr:cytochrome c oxidase subunit II [Candidatus Omnitrophota bacterium]